VRKASRKTTYEKPVSLAGASFEDVVGALLKTPKPKQKGERELNEQNVCTITESKKQRRK